MRDKGKQKQARTDMLTDKQANNLKPLVLVGGGAIQTSFQYIPYHTEHFIAQHTERYLETA